jgi:hypothetical protein
MTVAVDAEILALMLCHHRQRTTCWVPWKG